MQDALCASCGDDGVIIIYNYNTHRLEGTLKFENPDLKNKNLLSSEGTTLKFDNLDYEKPAEVKICKFLTGSDILVSADLDGFIHFWCVTSTPHPLKNKLLCYQRDHSKDDVGEDQPPPYFPIRAIDYDPEDQMLYTGDEMGNMIKWDVSAVIEKLNSTRPKDAADDGEVDEHGVHKKTVKKTSFITQPTDQFESVKFESEDIVQVTRWRAHQDLIN